MGENMDREIYAAVLAMAKKGMTDIFTAIAGQVTFNLTFALGGNYQIVLDGEDVTTSGAITIAADRRSIEFAVAPGAGSEIQVRNL